MRGRGGRRCERTRGYIDEQVLEEGRNVTSNQNLNNENERTSVIYDISNI